MSHLSAERLAALGDDTPTPDEVAHLATCAECATERAAYHSLIAMAHAEREPFGLPLTRWDAIAAALPHADHATLSDVDEAPGLRRLVPRRIAGSPRWQLRIAAGLLLLAGGAIGGRVSAGAAPLPTSADRVAAASHPASHLAATTPPASALLTADTGSFVTVADAKAAQQRSELLYRQAAAFLAQHDSATGATDNPVAYRSRLAALDRVISTTREAMREAPHDPVINGYYLNSLGQREETLRQLNTALPTSLRLNSF